MARSSMLIRLASVALVSTLVWLLALVSPVSAQTTHAVRVGGEIADVSFTTGVIWFNGYDPGSIVINPGDTVVWTGIGGIHTVTSSERLGDGSFVYDSSPLWTPEGALAEIGPDRLLGPGSVYDLDTSTLAPGTYTVFCKIHPGMEGSVTITTGAVTSPIVNAVAGFGDIVFAQQAFAPANLSVPQGTTIRWTLLNPTEPHTITGSSGATIVWDSSPDFPPPGAPPGPPPVMLPGDTFSHTYTTPGTYVYMCKVHAYLVGESWVGMVGIVQVVPEASLDPAGAAALNTASVLGYIAIGLGALALVVALVALVRRKPGAP